MAAQTQVPGPNPTTQSDKDAIIVTAQKRKEDVRHVPISITVLSGKALDSSTFANVNDVLNTVPGIAVQTTGYNVSGALLSSRGVSASYSNSTGASTVAYYVDSVPFGLVRDAFVPDPNIYDLQRVEVLRGPQGTLYGASALNGVVRVLTNDPDLGAFDVKARTTESYTQYGGLNYGGDLAVNVPLVDDQLAARVTLGAQHYSGWIHSDTLGKNINSSTLQNERIKLRWRPANELTVDLSAWHNENNANAPSMSTDDRKLSDETGSPRRSKFTALGARITYDFPTFSASSASSYVKYHVQGFLDGATIGLPYILANSDFHARVFAEEINLNSNLKGPWSWSAGIMYRNEKGNNALYEILLPTAPFPPSFFGTYPLQNYDDSSKSVAVYGELNRRFLDDRLKITAGVRYFHDNNGTQAVGPIKNPGLPDDIPPQNFIGNTSKAVTPRIVITWLPSKNLTAYASFAQGFRSGMPQSELTSRIAPTIPAVKPDKLSNYEIGAKGSLFDGRVSYEAAAYHLHWASIQQYFTITVVVPTGQFYIPALVNAGTVSGNGVDLALSLNPLDRLTLTGTLSWNGLHFERDVPGASGIVFRKGERPGNSPEWTAGGSVAYAFPISASAKGTLSVSGNYISALNQFVAGPGEIRADNFLQFRARFGVDFSRHWTAAAFVDNANNWNGTQAPGVPYPQWSLRVRPRTFGLQLEYHMK
jgi:outer membrane receptor protein involved in Fe transport